MYRTEGRRIFISVRRLEYCSGVGLLESPSCVLCAAYSLWGGRRSGKGGEKKNLRGLGVGEEYRSRNRRWRGSSAREISNTSGGATRKYRGEV